MKTLTVWMTTVYDRGASIMSFDSKDDAIDDLTCNGVPTVRVTHADGVVETFRGFPFHIIEDKS